MGKCNLQTPPSNQEFHQNNVETPSPNFHLKLLSIHLPHPHE